MLSALDQYLAPAREIAIIGTGPDAEALLEVARSERGLGTVLAAAPEPTDAVALLAGRGLVDGAPAAYVCEQRSCQAPVGSASALRAALTDAPLD